MKAAMHFLQTSLIDMRVDLRRSETGMPEHLLNGAKVGAVTEKMRSEGVP